MYFINILTANRILGYLSRNKTYFLNGLMVGFVDSLI